MAYWLDLPTYTDQRGDLTVIDRILPFDIKRVYYIYRADRTRGGHRHHLAIQALVSLSGSCEVFCDNGADTPQTFVLDSPARCLIVEPQDWHTMDAFSPDSLLLVLSSEHYAKADYIDAPYR